MGLGLGLRLDVLRMEHETGRRWGIEGKDGGWGLGGSGEVGARMNRNLTIALSRVRSVS